MTKTDNRDRRIGVRLEQAQWRALHDIARADERSVSSLVRLILAEWLAARRHEAGS